MTQAWDRCSGLHWTRSDTAAALGHGRRSRHAGPAPASRPRRRERPQPPAETVKLFDRHLSLDALAIQVAGHEILIGPLRALALTAEGTAATFARGAPPPLRARLRRQAADAVPGGHATVCVGTAWIEGGPAAIVAIRRKMD
jgi:hypothetical protein